MTIFLNLFTVSIASIGNPILPKLGHFNLGTLIGNLVSVAIIFACIFTLIYLVWGGIEWITSGGDKAGMESARSRITAALIGLTIVAAAWAIMMLVSKFFGFSFKNITIPGLK